MFGIVLDQGDWLQIVELERIRDVIVKRLVDIIISCEVFGFLEGLEVIRRK